MSAIRAKTDNDSNLILKEIFIKVERQTEQWKHRFPETHCVVTVVNERQ